MTAGGLKLTLKWDSELLAESRFALCPSEKLCSGIKRNSEIATG
jgi:hypothetical protein